MNETMVAQDVPVGWGRKLAWGLGAFVVGILMPWMLVLFAIGVGMFVTAILRFGETWGVPTYLVLLALAGLVYAGVIYGTIRLVGTHIEIPWLVWPALLAGPIAGLLLTGPLVDPTDVLGNPTVVPALLGIAIAFIALGKRRWTAVA